MACWATTCRRATSSNSFSPSPGNTRGAGCRLRALTPLQASHVDDVSVRPWIGTDGIDRVLLDLLGSRRRQAWHDVDPARRLVVGEPLRAMAKQHVSHIFRRFWLAQDHARQDLLLAQLVLDRHHGGLLDI